MIRAMAVVVAACAVFATPVHAAKPKNAELGTIVSSYVVSTVRAGGYSVESFRMSLVRRDGPYSATVYFTLAADHRAGVRFKAAVKCVPVPGTRRVCLVSQPVTLG